MASHMRERVTSLPRTYVTRRAKRVQVCVEVWGGVIVMVASASERQHMRGMHE